MVRYAVHFEFEHPVEAHVEPRHDLEGDTLEGAKVEAAILYAMAEFGTPPTAYAILQDGGMEVYRYPEPQARLQRG